MAGGMDAPTGGQSGLIEGSLPYSVEPHFSERRVALRHEQWTRSIHGLTVDALPTQELL